MAFPATTYTNGVTAYAALKNKVAALGMTSNVLDFEGYISAFLVNFLEDPTLGAGATFAAGTITVSEPGIAITQTWNDAAVTFKASTITITDTNSAAASVFVDYLVASSSKFSVSKAGAITCAGGIAMTGALSGATTIAASTSVTVTSASAVALAVGLAGATNPAFVIDSSTGSQAAGLKVTGAATGGTVAIAAIDSGSNTNLTINGKGTGTIGIGSVSTGAVTITPATTVTGLLTATAGLTSVAAATLKSGTAVPATAGAVAAGAPVILYSTSITVEVTSDTPTHTRPKGSICINTGGSSTSTRMYVNTDGAGTWASFTTSA